jgi:Ca-activated chloride channel family protein
MRFVGMLSMTALILTGLPPAPLGPAPAEAQSAARTRRPPPPSGGDPDARCAPFLQAGGDYDDSVGYGRGRSTGRVGGVVGYAPPPPPSPPPITYSPPPQPRAELRSDGNTVVTGQRIPRPGDSVSQPSRYPAPQYVPSPENRERYAGREVAAVTAVADQPVSTFSVDVDTGAYSNVRRLLNQGQMPPEGAVRTEELINYFRYDYPLPQDRSRPFSVSTDMTTTPWNPETRLLRVGLRGYDLPRAQRPAANLVFLVDVSGSMQSPDKLPLVQCSLALLADRLSPRDRVAIVVYAGAAGDGFT